MERHEYEPADPGLTAKLAAIAGVEQVESRGDGLWISAPQLDVQAMAREMTALGGRLATMTGLAREGGETTIVYHYVRRGQTFNFKTSTRGGAIASLAPTVRAASWIEREIHDFYAVDFVGHPNLAPLLRPPELKEGFFRVPVPGAIAPDNP